jgi:hypothetical protein
MIRRETLLQRKLSEVLALRLAIPLDALELLQQLRGIEDWIEQFWSRHGCSRVRLSLAAEVGPKDEGRQVKVMTAGESRGRNSPQRREPQIARCSSQLPDRAPILAAGRLAAHR